MDSELQQTPIFPGSGGLRTNAHPTNIGDAESPALENVVFDNGSIESPGGARKLHRDIPISTGLGLAPASIVQAAADVDLATVPWAFAPYHEAQDPATKWQLDISFRLNHKTDSCLTGLDQNGNVVNAPLGGEFQFQPLVQRGGDDVTRLQWILGACVVNPAGTSGAAEFIRPVFYWWNGTRLVFSAAFTVIRPGQDYHIQLQIGDTAADSRWVINGVEQDQITDPTGELIVALPTAADLYDEDVKRALYFGRGVTRTTGVGRYADAQQIAGIYDNGASTWTATSIIASPALPVTSSDAWKGYFVRRRTDGVIRQVTTSAGSTLTFASSSWSGPSSAHTFDLIAPIENCPQDCVSQEARLWSDHALVKAWDYSSSIQSDGFLPQIRMQQGDEEKGIKAFFYRSDNGAEWKVRGTNLLYDGAHWAIFTTGWSESRWRGVFQDLRQSGMNSVRVILGGGLAVIYGVISSTATELPDAYTQNFARFLEIATEEGVYVNLCLNGIPPCTRYLETYQDGVQDMKVTINGVETTSSRSQGYNAETLSPAYLAARLQYLSDFFANLRSNISDERYLSAIATYEIANEALVTSGVSPLTEAERIAGATVQFTNAAEATSITNEEPPTTFRMNVDSDRQRMVLRSAIVAMNTEFELLRELIPDTLLGTSITTGTSRFRTAPNLAFRRDTSDNHPIPLHAIQDQIDADFFSIHTYFRNWLVGASSYDFSDTANAVGVGQMDLYRRPIFCGEIGIDPATYPALDSPTLALMLAAIREMEEMGYKGYLWWVYGLGNNALSTASSDFWLWNEESSIVDRTKPQSYPAYAEVQRTETLPFALYPGLGTSDEEDAITRFEGLDKTKLLGYWPLNDDGGVMLRDLSATANHAWMKGLAFETTRPGEVLLDGERTAIQLDLKEEPDLYGAWRHSLGAGGRRNICVRARVRICRDLEDNGESNIEDCLYETIFDWDDPKSETAAPILSLRWTKHDGTRKFYIVWDTGSGQEITEIANAVETNPQTSATLALGLQPSPGREFTILAGIQTVDGDVDHRVYCFVLDAKGNAIGYSTNVTPATPGVVSELGKNRVSFGASVVGEELKGSGTKNAGMFLFRDLAFGLHPVVDTRGTGTTASDQQSMELSPFVSHGQLDVVEIPIGEDAGLITIGSGEDEFTVLGGGLLVKDRRHIPKNWLATVPAFQSIRKRENRKPFGRPKFVALTDVTASGGTLGDPWDEQSQEALSIRLVLWLAATSFPRETDALASNPMPREGESWALTPLWKDEGVLGSVDPVEWHLAIIPSRPSTAQERFAPQWKHGIVKGFEAIRGEGQVDIKPGDRHHINAIGGTLYRVEERRVADHPFFGEDCPRGGTYDWCVELPERPIWLSQEEELRQPKRLSVPRERDPWREDGIRITDAEGNKWWLPNNSSTEYWWLMEAWVNVPSVWGRRTISSRVGTEQGATSLVQSVNHHFYLDAGVPEFEIRDDLNSRSFRMFIGTNAKMKMREVVSPNVWTHLAVMVNVTTSGAISAGDNGFFVNGQRIANVHQEVIGGMTCAQIPSNVTQSYLGAFGQGQTNRFTPWSDGLGGKITMARIKSRSVAFTEVKREKW